MQSSLSTPLASRRMSENFQQDNAIDRTPRSAMTLSRREMLEQWRASKRHRDTNQSVVLSENLPFNGRRGNLPPLETPQKPCELNKNISTEPMTFEETTGTLETHSTITSFVMETEPEQLVSKLSEGDSVESETAGVEAVDFNQQADSVPLNSVEAAVVDESDDTANGDSVNLKEPTAVDAEPTKVTIEPIMVEPLQEEECKEDVMSQITLDQQMDEYDIPLLLLANDTLVLQLAECEARRIAECSRLRQERDELKLELNMQEARFKVHVKRMEHAMQEGIMASLERIQELSSELEDARAQIESLQLKSGSHKRG